MTVMHELLFVWDVSMLDDNASVGDERSMVADTCTSYTQGHQLFNPVPPY